LPSAPAPEQAAPSAAPAQGGAAPAAAGEQPAVPPAGEELVYLNVQEGDIKDVIKQISKATGRNFIIDDKVKGKVTIISERPMTREEAYQTFLSALEVAGFTIVKGPAGVIKVISLKDAIQEPIPTHVDTTPVTDMFITRLIPLQNISAVEISNAIKGLVSREGNLFAYPATNTLIITDSGTNIDRLMKIIKELDQEGPQQVLEIIPIANATARDISQMVTQLFDQQKAAGAKPAAKKGGELEEMAEVSKIIADERTNSVIVLASRRAIDKVRSIIQKLDRTMAEGQEGKIHVYYLKHAKAKTMAETLSTLTAGAGAAKKDAKSAASAGPVVAEFEGGLKVTADETTNSLIITSSAKDFQTLIDKVISKLDIPRRQVYLEAVVMELSVKKDLEYGMGGAFGGGSVGPFNIFGSDPYSSTLSGFLSGTPTLPTGLIGGLLGKDTIPITVGD
jgi:general secretion pathway protein D